MYFCTSLPSPLNLNKTDDSVMDASSDWLLQLSIRVSLNEKMSTSLDATDNRLIEMSEKFEERKTTLTKQMKQFQKKKQNTLSSERPFLS